MNGSGSLDRVHAISDAAQRRAWAEALVEEISNALAASGRYAVRIDPAQTQLAIDFSCAARQAGRRLGIRVDVDVKVAGTDGTGFYTVTRSSPPR